VLGDVGHHAKHLDLAPAPPAYPHLVAQPHVVPVAVGEAVFRENLAAGEDLARDTQGPGHVVGVHVVHPPVGRQHFGGGIAEDALDVVADGRRHQLTADLTQRIEDGRAGLDQPAQLPLRDPLTALGLVALATVTQGAQPEGQVAAQLFEEAHLFVVEGVRLDRIHIEGTEAGAEPSTSGSAQDEA
jgi:hypothetical protein